MSKPKKWEPGEFGFIYANEMYDIHFDRSVKVEVLAVIENDLHPVKVKSIKSGVVYYCKHEEIQTRAAKAERKPAKTAVSEDIRKEASKMAEKRMEELKNEGKPTFAEVTEKFYALAQVGSENKESPAMDTVIALAEKALFEEIKNGVTWK